VLTAGERPPPEAELGASDLDALTLDWAGRWLVVAGGRLSMDAAGTLGCFTRRIDGAVWASSSPELLRIRAPELARPASRVTQGVGMDWFPPPGSGVDGLRRLLPTQRLELPGGAIVPRPLPRPIAGAARDDLLASMADRLVNAVRAFAKPGAEVRMPLSAGRDSRVLLAAAMKAGASVRTYAFDRPTLLAADRILPAVLAARAGLEFRLLPRGPVDPQRIALWDRHTAEHSMTADRDDFARGQLEQMAGSDADLGGNVFEVGRCNYHGVLPRDPGDGPEDMAGAVLRELPSHRPDDVLDWARWVHETRDDAWDWRDRLYLEQRLGGWLGAICQGFDLAAVPRVHVASCGAYIAETMSLDEATRRQSLHHPLLIERMAPALAGEPFNAAGSLRERLRHRATRELAELRSQRTPWAYVAQRSRRIKLRRAG
jgi:hypothetical protein